MTTAPLIDCRLQPDSLDPQALRRTLPELPTCGGYAAFEGLIRNINEGKRVARLDYEAYETLALKELERICGEAAAQHGAAFIRVVHRTGRVDIGETAVMIQALAPHRAEAFAACRQVIDRLKAEVPIWKKELYDDGTHAWPRCHEHHRAGHAPGRHNH